MCGICSDAPNYFSGLSKFAGYEFVVFSKGTIEKPKGDCMRCFKAWEIGGWAEGFDSREQFMSERDKDQSIQDAFVETGDIWVEAHNTGKRCRPCKQGKRGAEQSPWQQMQEARCVRRKRVLYEKKRGQRIKDPLRIYTPERYLNAALYSRGPLVQLRL